MYRNFPLGHVYYSEHGSGQYFRKEEMGQLEASSVGGGEHYMDTQRKTAKGVKVKTKIKK